MAGKTIATYLVRINVRVPADDETELEGPTLARLEQAVAHAVVELLEPHPNASIVNVTAERVDA